MKPIKLEYEYVVGAGHQIKAHVGKSVECVEFTLRGDVAQPILKGSANVLIGYSPFIQFAPADWNDMLAKVYGEMVDAWNEKHSNNSSSLGA